MDFQSKVAIATGAASGMGLLFAQNFAALGGQVLMCDINEATLAQKVNEINAERKDAAAYAVCDVRDYAAVSGAVQKAVDFGSLHRRYGVVISGQMFFKNFQRSAERTVLSQKSAQNRSKCKFVERISLQQSFFSIVYIIERKVQFRLCRRSFLLQKSVFAAGKPFMQFRKFFLILQMTVFKKQQSQFADTVGFILPRLAELVFVEAAIVSGSIKQNQFFFNGELRLLGKKYFQPVKIPPETQTLNIARLVFAAQRVEPVRHKAVIDLLRINFPFAGNTAQHNVGFFVVLIGAHHPQQLSFRQRQRSVIAAQKIIARLLENPDIAVIGKKQKSRHTDTGNKYQY